MCANFGTNWLSGTKWYQNGTTLEPHSVNLDFLNLLIKLSQQHFFVFLSYSLLPRNSTNVCNHFLLLFAFQYFVLCPKTHY